MKEMAYKIGCLREIRPQELEKMLSWRNAPSVRANMYTRHEISLEEHRAWWDRIQSSTDHKYFMYEFESTPLGIVSFNGIDQANQTSSWAFYASPEAPKGTGSKMEYLAVDHAFRVIQLHKLTCEVLAFNTPVIRLHEKFGFKVEGIFREQHKIENVFVDIYRLGILSSDWTPRRDQIFNRLLRFSNR